MMTLLRLTLLIALCSRSVAAVERHVVVISIDGLPAYLLDDPKASLPTIRGLIARGAVAEGGMNVVNPAVTWPNHTTLMTGLRPESHGVIFNGVLERKGPGRPTTSDAAKTQRELVRVPLLFDLVKAAGKTSAAINWPCTRESGSIDDNMPDVPDLLEHTTPRLRSSLSADGLLGHFNDGGGVVRDHVWSQAASLIIRDRMPDLLAVHLLNLDGTHHRYGPRTAPGYTAAALADAQVGDILRTLQQSGHAETTTVFVVSDHGFINAPKSVRPNVILRKAGWLEADDRGRVVKARAHVLSEGGIGLLYFTDPKTPTADRQAVGRLFEGVEGVAAVVGPEKFSRYGLPSPDKHPGMADLVIACRDGYSIGASAAGNEPVVDQDGSVGVHGYLSTEPKMKAIFVASGAGIRPGARLGTIENVDVAPTVARILGVELPTKDGRVLDGIFLGSSKPAPAEASSQTSTEATATVGSNSAQPAKNVVVVTLDGFRYQEFFGGADETLIDEKAGGVHDTTGLRSRYWRDTAEKRRKALLPFVWNTIATRGQIFGDQTRRAPASLTNGLKFSYPGYSEMFCGFADPRVDSNDKVPNPNPSVLEFLNEKSAFKGRVAAFCTWDVFPSIFRSEQNGLPVLAGWSPVRNEPLSDRQRALNVLIGQLPHYWEGNAFDAITIEGAKEHLRRHKPRVLYIGLGETDEWAHERRYDLYLDSAHAADRFLKELWSTLQAMPEYRDSTALLVTTDHGRGSTTRDWTSHGPSVEGAEFIWIAAIGSGVPPLGVREDLATTQSQVASTIASLLGEDFQASNPKVGPPLPVASGTREPVGSR